ncbi:hypothetical protein PMI33_00694 [Pseudomonas sp. GM67]|nr:hypothetical protein PMI33_00694 [Pseudomonas sp. GM67]
MSNWKMFRLSLAAHPGLGIGFGWPALLAVGMLSRDGVPPVIFWLTAYPAFATLPWIAILCTAWSGRKHFASEVQS